MPRNPYAPPDARVDDQAEVPSSAADPAGLGLLYSPNQIAIASFLGSPIAAAWFASSNFRVLARPSTARKTVIWGFVTTLGLLALAATLPMRRPESITLVGATLAIRALAQWQFAEAIEYHVKAGGGFGSWWRVVAIGMFCALSVYGVVAGAYLLIG